MEKNNISHEDIIEILYEIGSPREVTCEILYELIENPPKYVNDRDAINTMLLEKLGVDLYITLINYKGI